ncbi:hypothetical protein [Bacillus sp. FSL K6-3431]|uniref:hypothetical protein n=1 Tax=Bacillus sp. FSL K6-3431 TaxID=2921500 RepID=UPI0030FC905E
MMRAQTERKHDEYERMTHEAFMMRQAYHAKRLKPSDLFKRPIDEGVAKSKSVDLQEKAENATEWLAQFANFSGKEELND